MQYFEKIVTSYKAGQFSEAEKLFCDMPVSGRKAFVKAALTTWNSGLGQHKIIGLIDLI